MPTHYKGSDAEVRALDAFIKLARASSSLASRLEGSMHLEGLTEPQLGVMETIYHLGPMCQKELGAKQLSTGGNITLIVDNLEKRGLVERVRNTEDRRYITVHLTEEGKKLMKRVFPRHAKAIAEEFAVLSPDEQALLSSLCKKLGLGKPEYAEALTKVRRSSDG